MPTITNPDKKSLEDSAHASNLAPVQVIRTETVLSRLPIHNLAKKGNVSISIIKRNSQGEIDVHWKVTPHSEYGQPRQLAYKLDSLVINRRIDEAGRPLPEFIYLGSLRDIAKELNLGTNTVAVKKALRQNAHAILDVKIKYKDASGTEREAEFESSRYGIVFTGTKLPNGKKANGVYLIPHAPYRQILNNAPIRPLNYDYLKALTPAAQRFYEIVSYKIFAAIKFKHAHAKLSYSEYCTFSAQQRYDDYTRVKKQMYKVHRPHIQSGYIKSVHFTKSVDEIGATDWVMEYEPGAKAFAEHDVFSKKRQPITAAPPPKEDSPETQTLEIVGSFYQRFHNRDEASPTSKELEQAKAIVEKYGIEKARFIIAYSYEKAQETKYKPQLFGGILQYVDPAVQSFTAREQKREQQKLESQEHDLQARYEQYREQEIEKVKAMLDGETLQSMEASIREDLTREGTFPAMIGMGVSMRIEAYLEERAGILPYEEWRTQQR
jgi:hypothetical protein